jgi:hypothetical protein
MPIRERLYSITSRKIVAAAAERNTLDNAAEELLLVRQSMRSLQLRCIEWDFELLHNDRDFDAL